MVALVRLSVHIQVPPISPIPLHRTDALERLWIISFCYIIACVRVLHLKSKDPVEGRSLDSTHLKGQ